MRSLLILLAVAAASTGSVLAAPARPYNPRANARADVRHALLEARADHKPVLLFFGANWCEDCRALARSLKTGRNAKLMAEHFNIVKIDVGDFNRNLVIDHRYGDPIKKGIPAAAILSPKGKLVYVTRAGELANARDMSDQGVYAFFRHRLADYRYHVAH